MFRTICLSILCIFLISDYVNAQHNISEIPTSINENGDAPDQSAILDVQSQSQGVLLPRMNFAQISAIQNPAEGLMVYDTEFNCLRIYDDGIWNCIQSLNFNTNKGSGNLTGWNVPLIGESDVVNFTTNSNDQIVALGDFDDGDGDYLATFDQSGNVIWEITTLDSNSGALAVDDDDFIIIAGDNPLGQGITKFDASGNILWTKSLNINASFPIRVIKLETDANRNIIVGGSFFGDITVGPNSFTNQGGSDIFIAKYDPNGNMLWVQTLGGRNSDLLTGMCVDSQNYIYAFGDYQSDFIFGSLSASTAKPDNYFLARVAQDGTSSALQTISSDSFLSFGDCSINEFDEVSIAGNVPHEIQFEQQTITLGNPDEQFFIAATIDFSGRMDVIGKTKTTGRVNNTRLATDDNGNIYVSVGMSGYSGDFGVTNFDNCPGTTYLVKYNYSNNPVMRNYDYVVPLAMRYNDILTLNNSTIYLYGTLRGQARFGNTLLTESNGEHNPLFVKYIE